MKTKTKSIVIASLILSIIVISIGYSKHQKDIFRITLNHYITQLNMGNEKLKDIIDNDVNPDKKEWRDLTNILFLESEMLALFNETEFPKTKESKKLSNYVTVHKYDEDRNTDITYLRTTFGEYILRTNIVFTNKNDNLDFDASSYDSYDPEILSEILELRRLLFVDLQYLSHGGKRQLFYERIIEAEEKISAILNNR